MKPLTKVQRLIARTLTANECYQLKTFCEVQAREKSITEHKQKILDIGVGNKVLVRGGMSQAVQYGLACLIGEVTKYNPKTVSVKFSDTRSWRIPYSWLTTVDQIEKEQVLKKHQIALQPMLKELNKVANQVLAKKA